MAQSIRIKRSTGAAAPATLAQGELAYSEGSDSFFVGSPSAANTPIAIGGAIKNNLGTAVLATGITAAEIRSLLSVDAAGTDNSTDVTIAAGLDYISILGQTLTLNQIDAATDISGLATIATTGNLSDATGSTSDISEGSNLYFTNARARTALSAGTGVTYDSGTGEISIGQSVGTGDSPSFANLTVVGTLNIEGTINQSTVTELLVEDTTIYLNSGYTGAAPSLDGGIEVERGTEFNARIFWNETADRWELDNGDGVLSPIVTAATAGGVSSVAAGDLIDISGSASAPVINVDLSELVDMTTAAVGTDELVMLDGGVQRRKAINEINLSLFNNDLSLTTTIASLTDTTITSLGNNEVLLSSGGLWINRTFAEANIQAADGNVDWTRITSTPTTLSGYGITDAATSAQGSLAATAVQPGDNISTLTNNAGYLTSVAFADLTTTPTTLAGYGITDAATSAQGALAASALQSVTVNSSDGSISGTGSSVGSNPSFDLEVAVVDGGTY